MSIKFRLTAMQFLQFFVWGAWLISLGGYMGGTLHFEGGQIGAIFATMGIASLIMPGLTGIIADKWINAERLYGILHLIGAGALIYASTATTYTHMYWAMLLNMLVYMPTLSLANTVSYNALERYKMDLVKYSCESPVITVPVIQLFCEVLPDFQYSLPTRELKEVSYAVPPHPDSSRQYLALYSVLII